MEGQNEKPRFRRTFPENVPSICIPRVYPDVSEDRIRRILNNLNLGEIERIDILPKTSERGERFSRVFVHFKRWNNSVNANNARERLLNGKEIKIIYDEPWFWKALAYMKTERKPREQVRNSVTKGGKKKRRTNKKRTNKNKTKKNRK